MMFNRVIPELKTNDLVDSYHFYTLQLGFENLGGRFHEPRVLLAREEVQLYLQFDNDLSTSTTYFRFKDLKPIYDALTDAKIKFIDKPETAWLVDMDDKDVAGLYQFRIADPDGNILVFSQELLPSECDIPATERMQKIERSHVTERRPSALEKTMAFRDKLYSKLPLSFKALLHPCHMNYFEDKQTLQLAFDSSKYLNHMFHLIQAKQEFSSIVNAVFGVSIALDIVSLPRQQELTGDLVDKSSVFNIPIPEDSVLDSYRRLSSFLDNERTVK